MAFRAYASPPRVRYVYPSQKMRFRASRDVPSSLRPIIFHVTAGCASTASLNATITLSAFANILPASTCGSSPSRISSRGWGPGSCAAAIVTRKRKTSGSREMELIDLLRFVYYYQGKTTPGNYA